jgi:hypothetical protein
MTNEVAQDTIQFCLWTAETELYGNGIFKPRQKCICWDGDFVEK